MAENIAELRYWCHGCSGIVEPDTDTHPELKCPLCEGGFIEEMAAGAGDDDFEPRSDHRTLSLWAPILLGMLDHPPPRSPRPDTAIDGDDLEREFEDFISRRRRRSVVHRLLNSLREDADDPYLPATTTDRSALLINAFNQAIVLQGGSSFDGGDDEGQSRPSGGGGGGSSALEEYFRGQGLDHLVQHLSESDPSRYGTPPARREVLEKMPTVVIAADTASCCAVCLDDLEAGSTAKEMPCTHRFHGDCIVPWLKLHSSCPVCRFQLPVDEPKDAENGGAAVIESNPRRSPNGLEGIGSSWGDLVPWPFAGLFSTPETSSSSSASAVAPPQPPARSGNGWDD